METSRSRASLCLSLTQTSLQGDAGLLDAHGASVDLAELRADCLDPREMGLIGAFAGDRVEKLILTVRRTAEGGHWRGGEAERTAVLKRALERGGFAFVDLEEGYDPPGLRQVAGATGTTVIRSRYDMRGVPPEPAEVVRDLASRPGEIPKLAVTPNTTAELAVVLEAMGRLRRDFKTPWILIGMGQHGLPTRVLATPLGAWLSYTSVSTGDAAPGQVGLQDMLDLYRFPRITPATRTYAVIGNPIAHSDSPRIHNAGYAALGLDAVYVPLLVDDVRIFGGVARLLDLRGVSVTLPHKVSVLDLLREKDATVDGVGACNTLVRRGEGWAGTNTDIAGFLTPLERLGCAPGPSTRATVIGAGGAARAVVWALRSRRAQVLVLNRAVDRARLLAGELQCEYGGLGPEGARRAGDYRDLVVQTTSCGMEPEPEGDPLPEYAFRGTETVYELVYKPPITPLLRRAQAAGCRTIGGIRMLREQAYRQFELFTGHPYPE